MPSFLIKKHFEGQSSREEEEEGVTRGAQKGVI